MTDPQDITPAVLLQHMQGMENRLREEFKAGFNTLDTKINRLETKVDNNHTQTMTALDNIDARLDDLEVVQVPKLQKALNIQ